MNARTANNGQPVVARYLYISDEAYTELCRMARMSGYIKSTTKHTSRGLSEYITFLMHCHMTDTRPDDVRAQDEDMRSVGMAPEWRMHGPRLKRCIKLPESSLILAAAHCLTLGIAYSPARRMQGAPTFHDTAQCMSALLEAIGTEWVSANLDGAPHGRGSEYERVQG